MFYVQCSCISSCVIVPRAGMGPRQLQNHLSVNSFQFIPLTRVVPLFLSLSTFHATFFSSPMESSSSHNAMVNSDDDHGSKHTCSVKINYVCITISMTTHTHNPFHIYHQYKYQYFCTVTISVDIIIIANISMIMMIHLKMFCCKPVGCLCEGKRWQSERIFIG